MEYFWKLLTSRCRNYNKICLTVSSIVRLKMHIQYLNASRHFYNLKYDHCFFVNNNIIGVIDRQLCTVQIYVIIQCSLIVRVSNIV